MQGRIIPEEAIDWVLEHYDTRRPAHPIPGRPPSDILVGEYQGRRLKVYVRRDVIPFYVTTTVWEGDE